MHREAMMTADLDIWRAANVLVKEYGDEAHCRWRACDALLAKGDVDGERVWRGILRSGRGIAADGRKMASASTDL